MALSEGRLGVLKQLVAEERTISYIHRNHGFNYTTIRKHFPEYRKGATKKIPTEDLLKKHKAEVNRLAEERVPGTVIANRIGITPETLSKHRPDLMWTKREAAEHAVVVQKLYKVKLR